MIKKRMGGTRRLPVSIFFFEISFKVTSLILEFSPEGLNYVTQGFSPDDSTPRNQQSAFGPFL